MFSRGWLREIWDLPKEGAPLFHQAIRGTTDQPNGEFDLWWQKKQADLVVHCVCKTCNSGWMNALDLSAQPIVNPMVRGERVVVRTMRERNILAAWVMKLALMIDWRQDQSTLPPHLAREFGQAHLQPPSVALLWLARNVPVTIDGHHVATSSHSFKGEFYLATFRVDQLVAQTLIVPPKQVFPNRTRHRDAVRQIWPPTFETVEWPPPRTLDTVEYVAFCHSFVKDFQRFGI